MLLCIKNIMEYNYVETHISWIYEDNIIIVKPHFNDDIKKFNSNCEIKTIIFSNYMLFDNEIIEIINNKKFYKKCKKCKLSQFNQPIDNLPQSIINLTLGCNFNQPVNNLPLKILNLTFGYEFNQSVDNLPFGILNLTFGYKFNCTVDNLPQTLLNLTFDFIFNQSVDNLPNSIIEIIFSKFSVFKKSLNSLPNSVCKIILPRDYYKKIIKLPLNIKKILCSSEYEYINEITSNSIEIEFL